MTELSFLIELLLNHKLPKATKDAIAARIKEVEAVPRSYGQMNPPPSTISTQPSSRDVAQRHPDLVPVTAPEVIGQTPAAMAAMASRSQAIAESMAGKVDKISGRPRKF